MFNMCIYICICVCMHIVELRVLQVPYFLLKNPPLQATWAELLCLVPRLLDVCCTKMPLGQSRLFCSTKVFPILFLSSKAPKKRMKRMLTKCTTGPTLLHAPSPALHPSTSCPVRLGIPNLASLVHSVLRMSTIRWKRLGR